MGTKAIIDSTLIDNDLTNFPVGIKLDSSHSVLESMEALGYEGFHFTVGGVECYAEVDIWDTSAIEAIFWVKVPSVSSSSNTTIQIDNIGDDNTSYVGLTGSTTAQNVWDSNFVGVYHMSQDPSASNILDSTSNGNDLTPSGSMASDDLVDVSAYGLFGLKGINFDGVNDIVKNTSASNLPTDYPMTFQIAGRSSSTPFSGANCNPYISVADKSESDKFFALSPYDNDIRAYRYNTGFYDLLAGVTIGLSEAVFASVTFVSSTEVNIFNDGVLENSDSTSVSFPSAFDTISVGGSGDSTPGYYKSIVSDIFISDIERSDAWIKATYNVLSENLLAFQNDISTYEDFYLDVTIDSTLVDSTLTNFPVGIKLDSSDNILADLGDYSYLGFHFTVGGVECYAEVDIWDMTNEESLIWVKVPSVSSSSDTIIKIENRGDDNSSYVGLTGSTPAQNVWDSNFVGVWHMSQDPSASNILDSTSNTNDAIPNNLTGNVDSSIGKAISCGTNSLKYAQVSASDLSSLESAYTLECLHNFQANPGTYNDVLIQVGTGVNGSPLINRRNTNSKLRCAVWGDAVDSSFDGAYLTWGHVVVTNASAGSLELFYDGTPDATNSVTITDLSSAVITLGSSYVTAYYSVSHYLGETRVSSIARSDAWIKATAENLLDNLLSKQIVNVLAPTGDIYGQISINGKNTNIISVSIVDKGVWVNVSDIYMLIDSNWRLNIKS